MPGPPELDVVEILDLPTQRRRTKGISEPPERNLLEQESVLMTVLAQDPLVVDPNGPVLAQISVPADRLQRGPRNHRFHVVDVSVGTNTAQPPVVLHDRDPWTYQDRWAATSAVESAVLVEQREALVQDRNFRAQNVFAVAAHTLALFEKNLGRPIAWNSGLPHLYLVPHARVEANAAYSREHNGVLFGWLPAFGTRPAVYAALSFDVIAHEVSHAVLDGLRPRFTEPGLPDQLAFHEALADLVALFSVFDLDDVAQHLLDPEKTGRIEFASDKLAEGITDPEQLRQAHLVGRAEDLKSSPLVRLAEQLGSLRSNQPAPAADAPARGYPALRRSIELDATDAWKSDPGFEEPHRRAEVLVAGFMQTFVSIWAARLEPLRADAGSMDVNRVAEEGIKAAQHLLGMLLRALDYLPPVELEFADVIDSVLTADRRLAPSDEHHYRDVLQETFRRFGISAPAHRILDEDGIAAPSASNGHGGGRARPATRGQGKRSARNGGKGRRDDWSDPDTTTEVGLRYEHLNFAAMRASREEIYQFIWSNAAILEIDVRLTTRVERVLSSTRIGPDGLIVTETLADYTQTLRTTAGNLPPGIRAPKGMAKADVVELWGGGVLVFDQFGRFRLHQRQPILDADRQTRRLQYLFDHQIQGRDEGWGTSDGVGDKRRFALLHRDPLEAAR